MNISNEALFLSKKNCGKKLSFCKINKTMRKYPKNNPFNPSIKFEPLIKTIRQKEVNTKLTKVPINKSSKKSILDGKTYS